MIRARDQKGGIHKVCNQKGGWGLVKSILLGAKVAVMNCRLAYKEGGGRL